MLSLNLFSQTKIDSLENKLTIVSNEEKVEVLNELAVAYKDTLPEKMLEYGKQALKLSQQTDDTNGKANALTNIASAYYMLSDYPKSIEFFLESINLFKEIGDRKNVAHDLKNPLAVIISFAELLNDEYSELSEEEIKDYIKQIVQDGNKMNNIINDLILFASLRKIEINIGILNMSDIVVKAINSLSPMIEKNNAEITFPDTFPSVLGYASWVEQVWVNYISNAVKFGGEHSRIKLTVDTGKTDKVPEGMVRFCVRDNGPGISQKNQTRIFKKFERLDQVKIEGHGLGLSIVSRIIKKLGGQVGVESEIGKGSLFCFTLPVNGRSLNH